MMWHGATLTCMGMGMYVHEDFVPFGEDLIAKGNSTIQPAL